jgi:hypothetical protein
MIVGRGDKVKRLQTIAEVFLDDDECTEEKI